MKITMKQGIALYNFYPNIKDAVIPIKLAYKFSKSFNKISQELEFYNEQLKKILDRYAERDEDGQLITQENSVKIKLGCEATCQQELHELDSIQIDLDDFSFTLDELENLNLTIEQMNALLPFIKE